MNESKAHFHFIDVMKGIAMLLVVMHHCAVLRPVSAMSIITMIDVPLFFIASGFLAYKSSMVYSKELIKKSKQLLLPFAMALVFAAFIRGENPCIVFISDITKLGYWFLEALYLVFVVYWVIFSARKFRMLYFCLAAAIEVLLLAVAKFAPPIWDNVFCFSSLARYFPCFMMGVYLREYKKLSAKIRDSKTLGTILLGSSVIGFSGVIQVPTLSFIAFTIAYSASALLIFLCISHFVGSIPSWIDRQLCIIGKYSLNVYIIHLFLVPHLATIGFPYEDVFVFEFTITLLIALVVTYMSIIIGKLLTFSTPLVYILRS